MGYDFDGIRTRHKLSDIVGRVVELTRDGNEFRGLCPFHNENTPSFTVVDAKKFFFCFGCGAHGDVIDFVRDIYGLKTVKGAIDAIESDAPKTPKKVVEANVDEDRQTNYADYLKPGDPSTMILPIAGEKLRCYNAKRGQWTTFNPSAVWTYYDRGRKNVVGCVIRLDLPDGKKITPMIRWMAVSPKQTAWTMYAFERRRPLYVHTAKDATREKPCEQVLIVEGEKCADAAARLLPMMHVVTWPGGTNAVQLADWDRLKGRSVVIWPDADKVGVAAAAKIAEALLPIASKVKLITWDRDKPKGWDIADFEAEGATTADVIAWMRERATLASASSSTPPSRDEASPSDDAPPPERGSEAPAPQQLLEDGGGAALVEAPPSPLPASASYTPWTLDIIYNEEGSPKPRKFKNFFLFLKNHAEMDGVLRFNAWLNCVEVCALPPWQKPNGKAFEPRSLTDADVLHAVAWLETPPRSLSPKQSEAHGAIDIAARTQKYNPITRWLDALEWDGSSRLDTWLTYYFGVADSPYTRLVGAKWLISAAARVMRPGCKADHMLILEGPQGVGKSRALEIIGTMGGLRCYTDEVRDFEHRDTAMILRGRVIVELAELHQIRRADVDKLKAWISKTIDTYRAPYARLPVDHPRTCVFAGSVNPDGSGYLNDPTGGRRFWPVTCTSLDLEALAADSDQLWAEAVHRMKAGERHYLEDEEVPLAKIEQSERTEDDVWGALIDKYIEEHALSLVMLHDILESCLFVPKKDWNQAHTRRVTAHMQRSGWERTRRRTATGSRAYGYIRSAGEPTQ